MNLIIRGIIGGGTDPSLKRNMSNLIVCLTAFDDERRLLDAHARVDGKKTIVGCNYFNYSQIIILP